jgi:hypothetical protein
MDLQTRKIEFIQAFLKLQSEEVISNFEKLLKKESKINSDFSPMTLDQFHNRIEKSSIDSKNENLTENSILIAEIEKWN